MWALKMFSVDNLANTVKEVLGGNILIKKPQQMIIDLIIFHQKKLKKS